MKKQIVLIMLLLVMSLSANAKRHHSNKKHDENSLIKKINVTVNHLPRSRVIQLLPKLQQNLCTALAIYEESRGISDYEQFLVVQTIKNREQKYNMNTCEVLAQKGQFPWVKRLNRKLKLDTDAWEHSLNMAIAARYYPMYSEPKCKLEYFSVGMFASHRRNLLCAMHLSGHYYYALK